MRITLDITRGKSLGLYSCCSSNEYVIRAALRRACQRKTAVLIEATANQVNQYGGYTGMTPQMFHDWVFTLAAEEGLAPENVILGGDHLGPLTFAKESETVAMEKAGALVRAYAAAGFQKIHLDTSMLLGDDTPGMLTDETIARRSAELCIEAEAASKESMPINHANQIRYVIGSEVPIPGGVQGDEDGVAVTSPEAYQRTIKVFEEVYRNHGLEDAWERVIAVVVQPGVEFGDNTVIRYDRAKAEKLTSLARKSRHVLEGHSTDYQTAEHGSHAGNVVAAADLFCRNDLFKGLNHCAYKTVCDAVITRQEVVLLKEASAAGAAVAAFAKNEKRAPAEGNIFDNLLAVVVYAVCLTPTGRTNVHFSGQFDLDE